MIYTDEHILISDVSDDELHSFAKKIGIDSKQFKPGLIHRYILPEGKYVDAEIYGARYMSHKHLLKFIIKHLDR